jgi:predicted TIM-barrel fold metal-dependent hydrolase
VELALCRSYNRWLADIWRQEKERLRWAAVVPLMSMEQTLAKKIVSDNARALYGL